MAAERVDKGWQKNGLEGYSTEAILGTLRHYGVDVDAAAFREQAKSGYPAHIAHDWHAQWKGTGQFSKFPYAAANELWKRLEADRLRPTDLSDALSELMIALQDVAGDEKDVDVEAPFARLEALRAKVPADQDTHDKFMEDVVIQLGEDGTDIFDGLAEELAKAGKLELARRFVEVEEGLLPERVGISRAVVRAVGGEMDGAIADLESVAKDEKRELQSRVLAVDAMIHLDAHAPALSNGENLLDVAEKAEDYHLALALCDRLAQLYEKLDKQKELRVLADRAERIGEAHDRAHPHHSHH